MKPKHFPLLTAAATDLASGGGAAVETQAAAAPAVETPAAPAAEQAAAAPAEPTFLQSIAASIQSKGALVAENAALAKRAVTAETRLAEVSQELDAANERLISLESERAEIQRLLEAAKAEKTTVEQAAAAEVASMGFPQDKLPESAKAGETREEIEARLAATPATDNVRRWELAEKLNKLNGLV